MTLEHGLRVAKERPELAVTQVRPTVLARRAMISSSHYLASLAGYHILRTGGNAVDAGVAAGFALGVVERHLTDLGGVAPIVVHTPALPAPLTLDGLGRAPRAATLKEYRERYGEDMPLGVARAVVPAAVDAWLTALARFGRLSLAEVVAPARELAEGFVMHRRLAMAIRDRAARIRQWPTTLAAFVPDGRLPEEGSIFRQPDLGRLLSRLVEAEHGAVGRGRAEAIMAARSEFYRGEIARQIADFMRSQGALLDLDDLYEQEVEVSDATCGAFGDLQIHVTGAWSQGPVLLMALGILDGLELGEMEHNGPDHLHYVLEALKLAFADREEHFGDPRFVDVPLGRLLDPAYAAAQRARLRPDRTISLGFTPLGGPVTSADTSYVCAADGEGNVFSATPSDSALTGPVVPGLGITVSTRGAQFWLDPSHPSVIAPRKRPRLTPSPALVCRGGRPLMPIGCPGGDAQTQGMLQVLLNVFEFGMPLQQAIEAPRACTWSFPNSFWPHTYERDAVAIEGRIAPAAREELARRGHVVEVWPDWTPEASAVCAILIGDGVFTGGADPRLESLAIGW